MYFNTSFKLCLLYQHKRPKKLRFQKLIMYLPIFELSVLFCNFGPVFSASGATSGDPEALHAPPRPSVEGHNMGLDTWEFVAQLSSLSMANGDFEMKWPISQSFTRLRTLQKLGLGDFDLARRPPRLIPLFRLVAFLALEAFTCPTGVLLRFRTALAATFGESFGTVRLSDIPPPSTLSLKSNNIRLGNVFCYFRSQFN